jgi:ribose transport system ATP-binding protein
MNNTVLSTVQLTKYFGEFVAFKNVNIELKENEVIGIVGENGAGKSTLLKCLNGLHQPDKGEIVLKGKNIYIKNPTEAAKNGIGMVYQEQSVLPNLTVAENIYLGQEDKFNKYGLINKSKLNNFALNKLIQLGSNIKPQYKCSDLSFADKQIVEFAKVLTLEDNVKNNLIILLDEPTSVLEKKEVDNLFEIIKKLKKYSSLIFVSHRLDEILDISDRIYVMKNGEVVDSMKTNEATIDKLHSLMVGKELKHKYYKEDLQNNFQKEVVLEIKNLSLNNSFNDINFSLHRGEVLGFAGVVGSGIEQLTRVLFGFSKPTTGEIFINEQLIELNSPKDAVKNGIGYLPKDRRSEGLIQFMSLSNNLTLTNLNNIKKYGIISRKKEIYLTNKWINKLSIKAINVDILCNYLSGGNQQKVVLAKWMHAGVSIMIMDHPTRGIDVGAKKEVYSVIRDLTNSGISIIIVSDTIEETIGLSNTIIVMKDGELTQIVNSNKGKKPLQTEIIKYMV